MRTPPWLVGLSLGATAALAQPPEVGWTGESEGDQFGVSVSGGCDVDGDGLGDIVIGASEFDGGRGKIYVYSGASGELYGGRRGEDVGDAFGRAVACVGDADGDGRGDVAVGARLRTTLGGEDSGRVYLYSGATGDLLQFWNGELPASDFGAALAPAGDVDGDGRADVTVGARFHGGVGPTSGKAYVYSGATGALLWDWLAETPGDHFGNMVAGLGDVDGDGFDDVAVGAPKFPLLSGPDTGVESGRAYVYSGGDGRLLWNAGGEGAVDRFAVFVGGPGDVDGDGRPDVLVGSRYHDGGAIDTGKAYAYSGTGEPLWSRSGEREGDEFGFSLAGAGDQDGDGLQDVLVGAYRYDGEVGRDSGRIYVLSGPVGELIEVRTGSVLNGQLGFSVWPGGDANGDGVVDLVGGSPFHSSDVGRNAGATFLIAGKARSTLAVTGSCLAACPGPEVTYRIVGFNASGEDARVTLDALEPGLERYVDVAVPSGAFELVGQLDIPADLPPVERCPVVLEFSVALRQAGDALATAPFVVEAVVVDP